MVGEDLEMGAKEVGSPFLKCLYDGKEFLLMNGVVLFGIIELIGVIGNWAGSFPSRAETQHSASAAVTGISGDIDIRCRVLVVNYGETVGSEDQVFDAFKGRLVFCSPWGEFPVTFLGGEWREYTRVFGECW